MQDSIVTLFDEVTDINEYKLVVAVSSYQVRKVHSLRRTLQKIPADSDIRSIYCWYDTRISKCKQNSWSGVSDFCELVKENSGKYISPELWEARDVVTA